MYVKRNSTHCQWAQIAWPDFRLFFRPRLCFSYGRMCLCMLRGSHSCTFVDDVRICTFVEPAVFVYIREAFSFGPAFGEDFGFDVMFLLM